MSCFRAWQNTVSSRMTNNEGIFFLYNTIAGHEKVRFQKPQTDPEKRSSRCSRAISFCFWRVNEVLQLTNQASTVHTSRTEISKYCRYSVNANTAFISVSWRCGHHLCRYDAVIVQTCNMCILFRSRFEECRVFRFGCLVLILLM